MKNPKKKSVLVEWLDAAVFAIVAATLIRWILAEPFTIPSSSMEKSLLVGDYLFVSKLHYGARTPRTPLQLPLTHQSLFGIPTYVDWIQLPQTRLPGFSSVKNNDVVVFNYPGEKSFPSDLRTNYIKRCMGIAGDSIEVRHQRVFINSQPAQVPVELESGYQLLTDIEINDRVFKNLDITDYGNMPGGYRVFATDAKAKAFKEMPFVKAVIKEEDPAGEADPSVFPFAPQMLPWNKDNYGPLWIPKKGAVTELSPRNVVIYGSIIADYEGLDNVQVVDSALVIDGKPVKTYTWQQDYYFMMGDNRHNSADSRFWGFVPADHIVGKAWLIWLSLDERGSIIDKIRFRRIFSLIK